jgi:mannose-1-phosphate guanylyltransferase/mannose-1-phosphate guanylyltransferase/mannose-6-phosphate isomerase
MIVPVILSGGEGKRLWPLSLPSRPKQFLALTGPESLLQQTLRRLADPAHFADPIIIGGADHRFLIAEQLREAGLPVQRIVLEPVARNTAPAVAVGALLALAADPLALILVAPADHAIPDEQAFGATVAAGAAAAAAGALVLFGLKPTFPSTGYGYIGPGELITASVRKVSRFVEKPAEPAARELIKNGYLWNSGIFLLPAAALVGELEALAPEVLAAARGALDHADADADFLRLDPARFAAAPSISIDHAVMEKTALAAVVEADFAWSDIGSWSALWDVLEKDGDGNVVRGRAVLEGASGCLVHAEGPQVAALGVSDLIVVATSERVLIIRKDQDQQLRQLAERADRGD